MNIFYKKLSPTCDTDKKKSCQVSCSQVINCINKELDTIIDDIPTGLTNFCEAVNACVDAQFERYVDNLSTTLPNFEPALLHFLSTRNNYSTSGNLILSSDNGTFEWVPGIPGSYTDEEAQDAVGTILTNSSSITWVYNDGTPSIIGNVSVSYIRSLFSAGTGLAYNSATGVFSLGTDLETTLTFQNGLTRTSDTIELGGTLLKNTTIDLDTFYMRLNDGKLGLNVTGTPAQRLSIGHDGGTSTTGTLFLYAPDNSAGNINVSSGAMLNLGGGSLIRLIPNLSTVSTTGYISINAPTGQQARQTFFSSGATPIAHIGLGNATDGLYIKPESSSEVISIYDAVRLVNIPQNDTAIKLVVIEDSTDRVKYRSVDSLRIFNGLTDATGTNSLDNANYLQEWQWNSLNGNNGLKLSSTSTAVDSNSTLFDLSFSGANSASSIVTRTMRISNTRTGTTSANYGIEIGVSGATTNEAIYASAGRINGQGGALFRGLVSLVNSVSGLDRTGNIIMGNGSNANAMQLSLATPQNTAVTPFVMLATTNMTAGTGFGTGLHFSAQNGIAPPNAIQRIIGELDFIYSDVTNLSEDATFRLRSITGGSLTSKLQITSAGLWTMGTYGSGTHTGTAAYYLAVDSSGNVIETAGSGGSGDNIYNIDGTVISTRSVNLNSNSITWSNSDLFRITDTSGQYDFDEGIDFTVDDGSNVVSIIKNLTDGIGLFYEDTGTPANNLSFEVRPAGIFATLGTPTQDAIVGYNTSTDQIGHLVVGDGLSIENGELVVDFDGTVTSVGLSVGTTGTDVNVSGSPITSSGSITLNIPDASATARGLITTGAQTLTGVKTFSGGTSGALYSVSIQHSDDAAGSGASLQLYNDTGLIGQLSGMSSSASDWDASAVILHALSGNLRLGSTSGDVEISTGTDAEENAAWKIKVENDGTLLLRVSNWSTSANGDVLTLVDNSTGEVEFSTPSVGDGGVESVSGTPNRITSTGGANPVIDIATTYVGQTSITTLGTIGTGVWQGTTISTTYTDAQIISVTGTTDRVTISGTSTDPVIDISSTYEGQASIITVGTITSGEWEGTSISTTYTDAKIESVTGTADRITVGGTAGEPVIDIASNYVGQTSIVTLGTVTTGTWQAIPVGTVYGGTGLNSYTTGDLIYAGSTNVLNKLSAAASGNALISGTTPSWGKIGLTTHVTGTLPVANGGTGQTTYTNGQLLIGNSTGNTLTKATLTGTTNQVNVTNGTGSITLSLPQSIHTTALVQFGNIGIGTSPSSAAPLIIGGSGYTSNGIICFPSISATANSTPSIFNITGTIIEASSGTHSLIAGLNIAAPTITSGSATVTNTATVFISSAPSATVTGANYALWVDGGTVRLDDDVLLQENNNYSSGGFDWVVRNQTTGRLETISNALSINIQSGTSYTFVLADAGKLIESTNSSAVTFRIPTNTAQAFPIGTQILIQQSGTGQITVSPDSGVTLNKPGGADKTRVQYSTALLIKNSTNIWTISGDIDL